MRFLENIPTGWGGTAKTIQRMHTLVLIGKTDPRILKLAAEIIRTCPERDHRCEGAAILDWVQKNIRFTKDPHQIEMVKHPWKTIEDRASDCDDMSILLATLAGAVGIPYAFKTIKADITRPNDFSHVYTMFYFPEEGFVAADASVKGKPLGWEPGSEFPSRIWQEPEAENLAKAAGLKGLGMQPEKMNGVPKHLMSHHGNRPTYGFKTPDTVSRIRTAPFAIDAAPKWEKEDEFYSEELPANFPSDAEGKMFETEYPFISLPGEVEEGMVSRVPDAPIAPWRRAEVRSQHEEDSDFEGMGDFADHQPCPSRPCPPSDQMSIPRESAPGHALEPRVPNMPYLEDVYPVEFTNDYFPSRGTCPESWYQFRPYSPTGPVPYIIEPGLKKQVENEVAYLNAREGMGDISGLSSLAACLCKQHGMTPRQAVKAAMNGMGQDADVIRDPSEYVCMEQDYVPGAISGMQGFIDSIIGGIKAGVQSAGGASLDEIKRLDFGGLVDQGLTLYQQKETLDAQRKMAEIQASAMRAQAEADREAAVAAQVLASADAQRRLATPTGEVKRGMGTGMILGLSALAAVVLIGGMRR